MPPSPLPRLRRLCLKLPDAHEVEAWGAPTFRVRNKLFAMYASPSDHHGAGRAAVWCKAGPGNQALMVRLQRMRAIVNALLVAWLVGRVTGEPWPRALRQMPKWRDPQLFSVTFRTGE